MNLPNRVYQSATTWKWTSNQVFWQSRHPWPSVSHLRLLLAAWPMANLCRSVLFVLHRIAAVKKLVSWLAPTNTIRRASANGWGRIVHVPCAGKIFTINPNLLLFSFDSILCVYECVIVHTKRYSPSLKRRRILSVDRAFPKMWLNFEIRTREEKKNKNKNNVCRVCLLSLGKGK